jgi:hypothetical protein
MQKTKESKEFGDCAAIAEFRVLAKAGGLL